MAQPCSSGSLCVLEVDLAALDATFTIREECVRQDVVKLGRYAGKTIAQSDALKIRTKALRKQKIKEKANVKARRTAKALYLLGLIEDAHNAQDAETSLTGRKIDLAQLDWDALKLTE
tara:strand:- start:96 stop:449 length:354 start_codon:yes stop_codon:yes gene_type:complete